jgi:hypothetical protein
MWEPVAQSGSRSSFSVLTPHAEGLINFVRVSAEPRIWMHRSPMLVSSAMKGNRVKTLTRLVTALATAAALGTATLALAPTASAETAPPPQMAVSPGCDQGLPFDMQFVAVYDGWLWWSACEECDSAAKEWASYGYSTWCWETTPGLAELWVGTIVPAGDGAGEPVRAQDLVPASR